MYMYDVHVPPNEQPIKHNNNKAKLAKLAHPGVAVFPTAGTTVKRPITYPPFFFLGQPPATPAGVEHTTAGGGQTEDGRRASAQKDTKRLATPSSGRSLLLPFATLERACAVCCRSH